MGFREQASKFETWLSYFGLRVRIVLTWRKKRGIMGAAQA